MKVTSNINAELKQNTEILADGRQIEVIRLENIPENTTDAVVTAQWNFPIQDIAGRWHPTCRFDRTVKADWSYGERSMSSVSAPVITFFSTDGKNRGTVAVSEALKEVRMNLGVHEEDGTMKCKIDIYLGATDEKEYEVRILQDFRDVRYEQSIREVGAWWENDCGMKSAHVPEDAKDPMYSFWYSYHQEFTDTEVEEECRRAKEMGFKTVIVDDGWQTDDTNRGYGFCGDWEVTEKKIKNMKEHVDNVHKLGMKYLLWFSVPYVGMYSKMWNLFHDKLITVDEEQKAGVLDIRYPEVRTYLKNIYVKAVEEWGLDGLKLDFIDEFYERANTPKANADMDCVCLQIALDKLLSETMEALKAVKEDILIEFRQRYIGPAIKKYGNMLRVVDCPESGLANRVGSVDLRLLSGETAVHSDPIVWHYGEKPEVAALQIVDSLFSTMQFSVRLDKMDDRQKAMVQNYMAFMREHKALLQDAPIEAKEPQNLYPEVRVKDDTTEIVALYSTDRVAELDSQKACTIIVNGTKSDRIYVKTDEEAEVKVVQIDCYGEIVKEEERILKGIESFSCTTAGRIEIKKEK